MSWLAAAGSVVTKVLSWAWVNPVWAAVAALTTAGLARLIKVEAERVKHSGKGTTMERFLADMGIAVGAVGETLSVALLTTAAASAVGGHLAKGFQGYNQMVTPGGATLRVAPGHPLALF